MARRTKSKIVVEYGQKFLMVFCDAEIPAISRSLTRAAAEPPAPCAGVPLPFGSPVPSGRMLMSQAAMAASSIGLPRLGVSANEASVIRADSNEAEKIANLDVNILDLPIVYDAPTGDRVVVLIGKGQDGRRFR